ncbi:MAG: methyltransferase domain-containing protein, partial [Clostridiales bacterium]|nr:methyltransferase domain-containing protein [Clostridiales bacterium]
MNQKSETNKIAWEYNAYAFWTKELGSPVDFAKQLVLAPQKALRRHIQYLGDVKGKKIANIMGSNGKKAIALSLLGADVTIIDFSESNKKYAMEVAQYAEVDMNYVICDILELDTSTFNNFDIVYLEGGILHYFQDLNAFTEKLYALTINDGKLVLNDFHPVRKLFLQRDIFLPADDFNAVG